MISLLLLPVLCLWHFYSQKSFEIERAMDLGLPNKVTDAQLVKDYPLLTKRNYKEFIFNGSLDSDKEDLTEFQDSLRHFNTIKDTINGIKLHFGKRMNYEVFIRVLDILTNENTPTYMPYKNELIIINGAPSDIEKERKKREARYGKPSVMSCGNPAIEARQRAFEEEQQRLIDNENFEKSFFKKHWYLFLAYFGILLLNIFILIKFNKNRIYNQKSYI